MHFDLLCLCYCTILVETEYREFASIVYHTTDTCVKCTDTEIEIGGVLSCQWMLAFLFADCHDVSAVFITL